MSTKMLTSTHMCELLHCSMATLPRWINDPTKNFPRPIKIGARRLWNADEVQAYLASKAQEQGSAA